MPDRDHWSAGMLLRWVLTRDCNAVLAMADDYGAVRVAGNNVTRVRPQTWDDVMRNYSIDDSLPKEEKAREAFLQAQLFIAAGNEIYSALRRGKIDGWARANGSGDIAKIEPIQWAGLRFRSYDGHDIAVPVDSEKNPFPLLRPLADYVFGSVPSTSQPTVWPDPLFLAEQAKRLWEPGAVVEVSRAPPQITPLQESRATGTDFPAANNSRGVRHGSLHGRQRTSKGGYFGVLEQFIVQLKPDAFARMSDDAVARRFEDAYERLKGTGKSAPPLPRDRRNIARRVAKIRERLKAPTAE